MDYCEMLKYSCDVKGFRGKKADFEYARGKYLG